MSSHDYQAMFPQRKPDAMTHTPAVDSLEHIEALQEVRATVQMSRCEDVDAPEKLAALDAAIAALTRPAGGSERLREALESIEQYGSDTLSGRTDGPDDRQWQRAAVVEMTRRATAALASPQGAEQRQEECPACHKAWTEHRSGYSASRCKRKATPHPEPAASQGDAVAYQSLVEAVHCYNVRADAGDKAAAEYWRAEVNRYAAALSSPTGVPSDQQGASLEGDESAPKPVAFLRDMLAELRLERHTKRNQWRIEALEVAIATLASGASPTGVQAAQVSDAPELTRLRELAGCLYAGPAAVHDLPEHWLDALLAASEGSPFSCDELLPYVAAAPNIGEMVNRFLGWKLPKDFHPDAGISFKPYTSADFPEHSELYWPIGTNLLTADQARAMFEHCLAHPGSAAHGGEDAK